MANFICYICDAKLDNLLTLQEHTRTHAMRGCKNSKLKITNKMRDETPCDVCNQIFDTPTKAISHKFKKHPQAPNTNFCVWCGKQFPIKYILEKHLKTHPLDNPMNIINCDHCEAYFCNVEAAQYHNNYFHKKEYMLINCIQTPPPSLKVLHTSCGDIMSAYYCQYCGLEYTIKYNLRQHLVKVHSSALSSTPPDDVIKCKMCEAIFYTVEAYQFHTTFHSDTDLFVTSEEMRQQIITKKDQDFDVRRVRVNQDRKKVQSQMKCINEITKQMFQDVENMASLSPPPSDSESDKEISEKEPADNAITIGEFFEMNKSILGDCVNADEVEICGKEVKRYSSRKKKNKDIVDECKDNAKKIKMEQFPVESDQLPIKNIELNAQNEFLDDKKEQITEPSQKLKKNVLLMNAVLNKKMEKLMRMKYGTIEFLDIKVNVEKVDLESLKTKIKGIKVEALNCNATQVKKLIPVKSIPNNVKPVMLIKKDINHLKNENHIATLASNNLTRKLPNKLIPISSIPAGVKGVKVVRKVVVPKGVLDPGVKMLTKRDLENLEKKGLLMKQQKCSPVSGQPKI